MKDIQPEEVHTIVRKILRNDSISITIETGDESISTDRDADRYIHYELGSTPREMAPVEHENAEMIPVTDESVVVAIWSEDDKNCRRYYGPNRFRDEFF